MGHEYQFSIKSLCELIIQTLDVQKDAVIAVTGETGSGKSTLALAIAKGCDKNYDMQKQMVFSREDLLNQIATLPPKSAIVCDEAIAIAYRREWMKSAQRELIKVLNICRSRNLIMIMCIPDFWALDKDVLYRIRMRIHVVRRGLAAMFKPDKNPWAADIWHKKENFDLTRYGWDVYPNFKRVLGWAGLCYFGPMAKYEDDEYQPLKKRKTEERAEKEKVSDKPMGKRDAVWKARVEIAMKKLYAKGMSQVEIAKLFEMTAENLAAGVGSVQPMKIPVYSSNV